jgi:hypothetical protein
MDVLLVNCCPGYILTEFKVDRGEILRDQKIIVVEKKIPLKSHLKRKACRLALILQPAEHHVARLQYENIPHDDGRRIPYLYFV